MNENTTLHDISYNNWRQDHTRSSNTGRVQERRTGEEKSLDTGEVRLRNGICLHWMG